MVDILETTFKIYQEWDMLNASYLKKYLTQGIKSANYTDTKQTLATQLGTSIHSLVLENKHDFEVLPEAFNPRSKDAKQFKEDKQLQGVTVVTRDYGERVENVADAIMYHDTAQSWLSATSDREISVKGTIGGVPCKARLDGMYFDKTQPEFILDIKTTSNFDNFENDFYRYGYDIQSQFYRALFPEPEKIVFIFIVAETQAPYRVKVISNNALSYDKDTFNKHVSDAEVARKLSSPHVYKHSHKEVREVGDIPSWLAKQREEIENNNSLIVARV